MVHLYDKDHKNCQICEQLSAMFMLNAPSSGKPLQDEMDRKFIEAVHGVEIVVGTTGSRPVGSEDEK